MARMCAGALTSMLVLVSLLAPAVMAKPAEVKKLPAPTVAVQQSLEIVFGALAPEGVAGVRYEYKKDKLGHRVGIGNDFDGTNIAYSAAFYGARNLYLSAGGSYNTGRELTCDPEATLRCITSLDDSLWLDLGAGMSPEISHFKFNFSAGLSMVLFHGITRKFKTSGNGTERDDIFLLRRAPYKTLEFRPWIQPVGIGITW